ncbi:MAG: hypothetical protein ACP5SB_04060 [Caldisericaceae bacterium]
MEDTKMYVELLNKVEKNKYKLVQKILKEGSRLAKINPDFDPFYTGDFLQKVEESLIEEAEDK